MTKKDYIAIAKAIKENRIIADTIINALPQPDDIIMAHPFIEALCNILKADNPLFDAKKFKEAVK